MSLNFRDDEEIGDYGDNRNEGNESVIDWKVSGTFLLADCAREVFQQSAETPGNLG